MARCATSRASCPWRTRRRSWATSRSSCRRPTLPEAALVEGIDVYPVDTLGRLAAHFRDYHPIEPYRADLRLDDDPPPYAADFQDIKG